MRHKRDDDTLSLTNFADTLSLRRYSQGRTDLDIEATTGERWASERAAIKAKVTRAKETVDLLRMAEAIVRLDALDAEIDAAEEAKSEK